MGPSQGTSGKRAWRAAWAGALAGTLLVTVTGAGGCSTSATTRDTAAASARLLDCAGTPHVQPAVVEIFCADSGIVAHSLRWSGWGRPVATATGTAVVNTCEYNDCYAGTYQDYPIVLAASRLTACQAGREQYGLLQYMFVGPPPFRTLPAGTTSAPAALVEGGPGTVTGLPSRGCGQVRR